MHTKPTSSVHASCMLSLLFANYLCYETYLNHFYIYKSLNIAIAPIKLTYGMVVILIMAEQFSEHTYFIFFCLFYNVDPRFATLILYYDSIDGIILYNPCSDTAHSFYPLLGIFLYCRSNVQPSQLRSRLLCI